MDNSDHTDQYSLIEAIDDTPMLLWMRSTIYPLKKMVYHVGNIDSIDVNIDVASSGHVVKWLNVLGNTMVHIEKTCQTNGAKE